MRTEELELGPIVAELARQRPDWLIWWSGHTCRYWGLGWMLSHPDGPVQVTGKNPGELLQHIDYIEQLYPKHPAPWRESTSTAVSICNSQENTNGQARR